MTKPLLDAELISKLNHANPEIQKVETRYVNEYRGCNVT